jgi:hypothetical protein
LQREPVWDGWGNPGSWHQSHWILWSGLIGLCLEHQSEGVVNAATGRSISFAELAERISRLCNEPVQIHALPRQTPVSHRHADTSNLVRAFPKFQCTSLADGLAETLAALADEAAAA